MIEGVVPASGDNRIPNVVHILGICGRRILVQLPPAALRSSTRRTRIENDECLTKNTPHSTAESSLSGMHFVLAAILLVRRKQHTDYMLHPHEPNGG